MCFAISSIKLFLLIVALEKISVTSKIRLAAEYALVYRFLWSYATDAVCMENF